MFFSASLLFLLMFNFCFLLVSSNVLFSNQKMHSVDLASLQMRVYGKGREVCMCRFVRIFHLCASVRMLLIA